MDVQTAGEIERLDDQRFAAMVALDYTRLAEIYADDMVYVHGSAVIDSKPSYFEAMRAGKFVYQRYAIEGRQVRVYGDTAVAHGRYKVEITTHGTPRSLDNIACSVWVKRAGRWQMVHFAATPVPKPA